MARSALAAAAPDMSLHDFKTGVLGGKWTAKHKGVPFDAIQGSARGVLAQSFCRRRNVQLSARFDVSAYGQVACNVLARAWCHRMQYYYNLELTDALGEGKVFTQADVDAYLAPTEFVQLVESRPHSAQLAKRIVQITALFQ